MIKKVTYSVGLILCLALFMGMLACSKAPSGPTDTSIAESLKSKLYSDPVLANDRVEVNVTNGEVTLQGGVTSDAARLQAYKLAVETPGVQKVIDQMQVRFSSLAQQAAPTSEPSSETPVTPKVVSNRGRSSIRSPKSPRPEASEPTVSDNAENRKADSALPETTPPPPPAPTQSVAPEPVAPPPPPPPRRVTLPAGTSVRVQMIEAVNSDAQRVGQKYQASLQSPIVIDNEVIVPKGADVTVMLTDAQSAGKISGRSELRLKLDTLKFQGKSYPLDSTTYEQVGKSRGKDTAKKAALGAAIGTAIGAIAGGGKGAAIGAGVGAGGGTAVQVLTHGEQVRVPSETILDFKLEQPVEITFQLNQDTRTHSDKL
jgi:BON domain